MEQLKTTYEKLNANQRELFTALNAKLEEALHLFEPNTKLGAFTQEMMESYYESNKTYLERLAATDQPEKFAEAYLAAFQQWSETRAASYEQATEFVTQWWEQYNWEAMNKQFTKLTELYQASWEMIWHTTNANAKLMQGMFVAQA